MEISIEQYNKMAERLTELEYKLAEQPEIVRCKDCEYYHHCRCDAWSSFVLDDGYCYKAIRERR